MPKRKRKPSPITKKWAKNKRKLTKNIENKKLEKNSELVENDLPYTDYYEKSVVSDRNCYYRCL